MTLNVQRQPPHAPISTSSSEESSTGAANQNLATSVTALDNHDATTDQAQTADTFIYVRHDRRSKKLLIEFPPGYSMSVATALGHQLCGHLDQNGVLHHKRSLFCSSGHQPSDIKRLQGGGLLIRLPVRERHRDKAINCVATYIRHLQAQCELLGIAEESFARLVESRKLVEAIGTGELDFQHKDFSLARKDFIACVAEALDLRIAQIVELAFENLDGVIDHYLDKDKSSYLSELSEALWRAVHDALYLERNDNFLIRLIPFAAKVWTGERIDLLSEFCRRFPRQFELPFSLRETNKGALASALMGDALHCGDLSMVGRLMIYARENKLSVDAALKDDVLKLAKSEADIGPTTPFDASIDEGVIILLCLRGKDDASDMAFDLFKREILAGRRPGNVCVQALIPNLKTRPFPGESRRRSLDRGPTASGDWDFCRLPKAQ